MSRSISILSTRALDAVLIGQAEAAGIRIDISTYIETIPIQDKGLALQVKELAGRASTVIFTSMNAVDPVADMLGGLRAENWRIFCIGAATRRQVEAHFGVSAIAGTAPSASGLAGVVLKEGTEEAVFFCGDQRREELPAILSGGGVHIQEIVVYRTVETPSAAGDGYDGIAFFSPSAVRSFFSVNAVDEKTCFFAIGETTAETIRTYAPGSPVIISRAPEKEALVHQIIEYFQTHI